MDDDLNVSAALAALFDGIREGNAALDSHSLEPEAAAAIIQLYRRWDCVFGIMAKNAVAVPQHILALLEQRQSARASKNWSLSDSLRTQISEQGWIVKDTPKGQTVSKA